MYDFLFERRAWEDNFWPGLPRALGRAWWAIVVLAIVGMVGAVLRLGTARLRLLGVAGLISTAAFLFTPMQLAMGRPAFFWLVLRYAAPALALGLVLMPIVLARWRWPVLVALFVTMGVTQLDPTSWPTDLDWAVYLDPVRGHDAKRALVVLLIASLVAVAVAVAWRALPRGSARSVLTVAAPLVVIFGGLAIVHDHYVTGRYAHERGRVWARDVHDARIASVGWNMYVQYPMYGQDLSNDVQLAGIETVEGGFRPIHGCEEWNRFLDEGRFDYAVVAAYPEVRRWTMLRSDALLVTAEGTQNRFVVVEVFRIRPRGPGDAATWDC
jgi:hypothetical protein